MNPILLAICLALVAMALLVVSELRGRRPDWYWYVTGYVPAVIRVVATWRKVARLNDLAVSYGSNRRALGGLAVKGTPLRLRVPRLKGVRPLPNGLAVRVRLLPGQTPLPFIEASEAIAHAWRMHAVRVISPRRGIVLISATATDPLKDPQLPRGTEGTPLLSAVVGALETGGAWLVDFRREPHWLVVGATRSGKSTLLARLVMQLAPQPVALVGVDCKGGMELGLFRKRLSALATSRREAVTLFGALVVEIQRRMAVCREAAARSIWELPAEERPVPVVVLVDEMAELYLTNGSKDDRAEAEQCSTYLLRLGQLGAALGVHLVIAGQRVGSDLGPGVTALRAQLGGRICHRVNDPGTAEMTLGDLHKDAVAVAQTINAGEQGVAVTTADTVGWVRARSHFTTLDVVARMAAQYADRTPHLAFLDDATEAGDLS
ncbi:FtsK/SpoIIIE domain-containing protein [Streptomyces cocklensis]|uniref:Transfer protein TraSA n=1 Tax=Actinacidiphila cocklensis TaxID=887465 RepID=A0A9W4EBI0_9ACTN|nr:FtsK/SpoIIIE domain-containing protein [Actinacidiphila cocklensis]MDD1057848.1 FtsK/SpoIIIE domain-containing protein [Actinacidiphila cocklensis]CAG6398584.1 Transfer protein TraSA [Actinacidiphila cocklensis]